jgi:hypothetical protein
MVAAVRRHSSRRFNGVHCSNASVALWLIGMDKKNLESEVNSCLSILGFSRKNSSWYRRFSEVVQILDLQKSAFGNRLYMNIGFAPVAMPIEGMPTPKESKFPVRIRADAAFPARYSEIEGLLDFERKDFADGRRGDRLNAILVREVVPFMNTIWDIESLTVAIKHGAFSSGAVSIAVRKYLRIGAP